MINWDAGVREFADMEIPHGVWPVLVWHLQPGEKVSKQIVEAAAAYVLKMGAAAQAAFINAIPPGAEEFAEVGDATLVQADWVPVGFVALARGGTQVIRSEYRVWQRR